MERIPYISWGGTYSIRSFFDSDIFFISQWFLCRISKKWKKYFMAHPSGWDIKYTFSLYYSSCINAVPVAIPSPAKHPHFAKRVSVARLMRAVPQPPPAVQHHPCGNSTRPPRLFRQFWSSGLVTGIHGGREILYVFLQQRR